MLYNCVTNFLFCAGHPDVENFYLHLTGEEGTELEKEKTLSQNGIRDGCSVTVNVGDKKGEFWLVRSFQENET